MANGLPPGATTSPQNQETFADLLSRGKRQLATQLIDTPTPLDRLADFGNLYAMSQAKGAEGFNFAKQQQVENQRAQQEQLRGLLAQEDERSLQIAQHALNQQIAEGDVIAKKMELLWPDEFQRSQAALKYMQLADLVVQKYGLQDDDEIPQQTKEQMLSNIAELIPSTRIPGTTEQSRVMTAEQKAAAGLPMDKPYAEKFYVDPATGKEIITGHKPLGPGIELHQTLGDTAEVLGLKAGIGVAQEQLKNMQEPLTDARIVQPRLEQIALGLESGKVNTGPFATMLIPFRQGLQELGWTVDENLSQAEQVRSAMAFLVPRMRVAGSGQTSNAEMSNFKQAAPQYMNSTEGNILIARGMLQANKYNEKRYDLALKYFRQDPARGLEGFGDYADEQLGPLYRVVKDEEDWAKVKKGEVYFHWHKQRWKVK